MYDWRIEDGCQVRCGSHNHEAILDLALRLLIGQPVVDIQLFGDIPELKITLENGLRLLTFSLDDAGPDWAIGRSALWVNWRDGELVTSNGSPPPAKSSGPLSEELRNTRSNVLPFPPPAKE